jgi:hypothetical protein
LKGWTEVHPFFILTFNTLLCSKTFIRIDDFAEKLAKFARITFMKDDIEDVASEEYLQKTINQRCK